MKGLVSPRILCDTNSPENAGDGVQVLGRQIWHCAVMSCPDKKLESARSELSDFTGTEQAQETDCVITASEIQELLRSRNQTLLSFSPLPLHSLTPPLPPPHPSSLPEHVTAQQRKEQEVEERGGNGG
eukprot:CAMPEP_0179415282 /NCGR_PEP_ID=MMETSP0799-20121207/6146_1 /TAXON_ID=46947 /ORGANISM="Geminigera cryophila, Strain CCMP2564" /LENGTH=127 /DNA_ID=CAMNT_0021188005 /DNA_START=125 /DNA_END=504 /DNA_ORIENTATION=+